MNITKLTLTPIYKSAPNIVIRTPEQERAKRLILERFSSSRNNNKINETILKLQFRKLPAYIKEMVNPKAYKGST